MLAKQGMAGSGGNKVVAEDLIRIFVAVRVGAILRWPTGHYVVGKRFDEDIGCGVGRSHFALGNMSM